jgi:hypothetical protein
VAIVVVNVPPPDPAPLTVMPLFTIALVNGLLAEFSVDEPILIEPSVAIWSVIVNVLPGQDDDESWKGSPLTKYTVEPERYAIVALTSHGLLAPPQ